MSSNRNIKFLVEEAGLFISEIKDDPVRSLVLKCKRCNYEFTSDEYKVRNGKRCSKCEARSRDKTSRVGIWKNQGQLLADRREALKIKKSEIAAQIGYTEASIYQWEKGNIQVPLQILCTLARILDIDEDELKAAAIKDFSNQVNSID